MRVSMYAALGLAFSCTAIATSSSAFAIDTAHPCPPLSRVLLDSFGSSHGSTTLRATWRSHFSQTLRDIPFHRVRFHGILDDDMSAFMNMNGAYGGASGGLIFDTLDFFVQNGITPTVELSYMPAALALNTTAFYRHYMGLRSTFASAPAWRAFITGLIQLMIDRYGAAVVRSWRFEVWNEPNCNDLEPANGCCPECGPKAVYFDLYKETALGIKAADPLVPVGGPATAMLAWIPEFTAWCAANGAPIDFISSHLYPTDPQLPLGRDSFMDAIANATRQAAAAGLPFLLTEFNAGLGAPADNHGYSMLDSSYAAAFLLHQHLLAQAVPNLASMSYWTFTDWGFEEQGVDPAPWAPGTTKFGLLNDEGVPKPAYRGLQMISQAAGDATLPVAPAADAALATRVYAAAAGAASGTVDASATLANGVVTVLLANFNASGCALPQLANVTLTFGGLTPPLPTAATLELIDDAHANAMAAWAAAGAPLYSPPEVILEELAASQVAPARIALANAGAGAVSATIALSPYAMARVRLTVV
jgi:xylan 1,4-beta-xylosidase